MVGVADGEVGFPMFNVRYIGLLKNTTYRRNIKLLNRTFQYIDDR